MKISELIDLLSDYGMNEGDLEVRVFDYYRNDESNAITVVHPVTNLAGKRYLEIQ